MTRRFTAAAYFVGCLAALIFVLRLIARWSWADVLLTAISGIVAAALAVALYLLAFADRP